MLNAASVERIYPHGQKWTNAQIASGRKPMTAGGIREPKAAEK